MHFSENDIMNPHIVPYEGWSKIPKQREILDIRIGSIIQITTSIQDISEGDIVLLGIPQDIGVERNGGRKGAAEAPFTVRECLGKFSVNGLGKQKVVVHDIGNIMCEGRTLEDIRADHQAIILALLEKGANIVVIGGGHDNAFPSTQALRHACSRFAVINIDPHLDVRELVEGKGHSGSPFREMLEQAKPELFIEFGTQQFSAATHHRDFVVESGGSIIPYEHIRLVGNPALQLSELLVGIEQGGMALHVSFDMDAVNAAYAPGVSASAPIGFTADEIVQMAYNAGASGARIIDIVEVNPQFDIDQRTSRLAALMIASCIAGWNTRL